MEDTFIRLLHQWQQLINQRLAETVYNRQPAVLYQPIDYVLEGGGKRLRPILVLLSCAAVGGKPDAALDAAVAVELLHNFTLVHDDIMDEDDTRRGRPTVHTKWEPALAILAGDGLFALAYQALLRTQSPRIHEIARIFTDGILGVCEGQALDLDFETRKTVSMAEYLEMIQLKTAELLNVSARVGALVGGGTPAEVDALGDFAINLGYAFQIQDDLLDIISEQETLGKTVGSDVQQGKQTFLLIHALNEADDGTRESLLRLLDVEIDGTQIRAVKDIFDKVGSSHAARAAVDSYLEKARTSLDVLNDASEKDRLLELVHFISRRNA